MHGKSDWNKIVAYFYIEQLHIHLLSLVAILQDIIFYCPCIMHIFWYYTKEEVYDKTSPSPTIMIHPLKIYI